MSIGTPTCSICADTSTNSPRCSAIGRSMWGSSFGNSRTMASTSDAQYFRMSAISLGGERPALHDALAHRVLALGADGSRGRNTPARRADLCPAAPGGRSRGSEIPHRDRERSPAAASRARDGRPAPRCRRSRRTAPSRRCGTAAGRRARRARAVWVCPDGHSCHARQTTSGRSPGLAMNSKSAER